MPLEPRYDYVESDEVVRLVVRLLDIDSPEARARSITLSRQRAVGSLRRLQGLGKEIWAGVEAQEYVNQLRDEWER
jgi:hypothetical protein